MCFMTAPSFKLRWYDRHSVYCGDGRGYIISLENRESLKNSS